MTDLDQLSPADLRSLACGPHGSDSHDEQCGECGQWITIGPDGTEYGHARGRGDSGPTERCPRRPESVDPGRNGFSDGSWRHNQAFRANHRGEGSA